MTTASPGPIWQFGDFTLDSDLRVLLHGHSPVNLTPKQFETLAFLVRNAGRVLTKDEMLRGIWPGSFVEESNLSQNIFWLRKALRNGDTDDKVSQYIVTVPSRGYRFDAPVTVAERKLPVQGAPASAGGTVQGEGSVAPSTSTSSPVWPRMLAAVLAACALAGAGLYAFRRAHPRPITIARQPSNPAEDRLFVLADVVNTTDDAGLTSALASVQRISLLQSPLIVPVSRGRLADALRGMRLAPNTPLTVDVAAQICQRYGGVAVVATTVSPAGSSYVLTVQATECDGGHVLFAGQATAKSKDGVIAALDGLLPDVRKQLGESPQSIRAYSIPVEQTTTTSLEAFKAMAQGDDLKLHGNSLAAIPFYQRAITLDPNFAMAYARIGAAYGGLQENTLAEKYLTKAYQTDQNMSPHERFWIESAYVRRVSGNLQESLKLDAQEIAVYPGDNGPWGGRSDTLTQLGRFQEAVQVGEEGLKRFPKDAVLHIALGRAYTRAGRLQDSQRICESAVDQHLDGWDIHEQLYKNAFLLGDAKLYAVQRAWATGKPEEYQALDDDAFMYLRLGKVQQARASQREFTRVAGRAGMSDYANQDVGDFAFALEEMGLHAEAAALMHAWHGSGLAVELARGSAAVGDDAAARAHAARLRTAHPKDTLIVDWGLPTMEAALALRRGTEDGARKALAALAPAEPLGVRDYYGPYLRGRAYLQLREWDRAQAEFQHVAEAPGAAEFSPLYALGLLGLARAHAGAGDAAGARKSYAQLLTLWKDADGDVPVVRAARRESAALS